MRKLTGTTSAPPDYAWRDMSSANNKARSAASIAVARKTGQLNDIRPTIVRVSMAFALWIACGLGFFSVPALSSYLSTDMISLALTSFAPALTLAAVLRSPLSIVPPASIFVMNLESELGIKATSNDLEVPPTNAAVPQLGISSPTAFRLPPLAMPPLINPT